MKRVHLPFDAGAATPLQWLVGRRGGAVAWAGVLVFAAAVAGIAAAGWQWAQARQELDAVRSELLALGRRPVDAAPAPSPVPPAQRRAWNDVVRQLNTPWATLLSALEAATPGEVALVSIEPDARQGSVRLQAEARSLDALLAYSQALREQPAFADVSPLKHETNEQDPNRPVRLTLNLRLRAEGPR